MDFSGKIIVIGGKTASGKTDMSIDICRDFNGEVVSGDSVQIYRYMDIGSAKPTISERLCVPHHNIDIVYPWEDFDVNCFVERSREIIKKIWSSGKIPVLTGGTGFYIESLLFGLPVIRNNPEIRRKYMELSLEKGKYHVYDILRKKWPERALQLHENDVRRVVRSLEIFDSGGSEDFGKHERKPHYDSVFFYIEPERKLSEDRIEKRVQKMIDVGLIDEVDFILDKKGFSPQSAQAIGYRETVEWIEKGRKNPDLLAQDISLHTRQFAKRQRTFFKNKFKKMIFLESYDINKYHIKKEIEKFLEGSNV